MQVENPIPFADLQTARLTTGYLHAKYAHLLLVPLQLSADWSYACIPYVHSLADPRNAATAALYAFLGWVVLSACPWCVIRDVLYGSDSLSGQPVSPASDAQSMYHHQHQQHQQHQQQQQQSGTVQLGTAPLKVSMNPQHELSSRVLQHNDKTWWMVIVIGLIVGPFLPAANILFYVGTFIGERLLYLPSLGFCLLLSHSLVKLMGHKGVHMLSTVLLHTGISDQTATLSSSAVSVSDVSGTVRNATAVYKAEGVSMSHSSDAQNSEAAPVHAQHAQHGKCESVWARVRGWLGLALLGALLLGYSWRTVTRNADWQDEETLFIAAQKVCAASWLADA